MGIETWYTATIVKACDGCGARYEANGQFSNVAAVLAFGGPIEAAGWQIHGTPLGVHLLCDLCVKRRSES